MTRIFLIRHAEAEGNIFRRAHGHHNGLITLKGHRQIELLKKRFLGEQVDAVYSSDLTRACTTAQAVAEPREMQIQTREALREVKMGVWEDVSWGNLEHSYPDMIALFVNNPEMWSVEGAESFLDVANRMYNCISGLAAKHDGKTIAVFSHGFAIRAFICRVINTPSSDTEKVPYYDNTAVTFLTFDGDKFHIEYAGDNSHLSGGNSTLENQSWWRAETKHKPENLCCFPLSDVADDASLEMFKQSAGSMADADTEYAAYLAAEPIGIAGFDTLRNVQSNAHTNAHGGADKNVGLLKYVYVAEQHRRRTFGTQLVGLAVSDFRKLRFEAIRIELPSNSPSADFFRKCGFSVVSTTGGSCRMEKDIKNW